MQAPGDNDFIIAGCPRSGTSLLAAMLFQPPEIVTVMEPWDGLRMPPAELFRSLRAGISESGMLDKGRLDVRALLDNRVRWQRDGEASHPLEVEPGFQLGVKWPTFWQYLELLPTTRFLITVRHPEEVITSFENTGGRLAEGLDYDVAFNSAMNRAIAHASEDPEVRRVLLFEYINSRVIPHLHRDNVFVVRYERWFHDPAGLLAEVADFLGVRDLRPTVDISAPEGRSTSPRLRKLISSHAPSAEQLGYDI